MRILFITLIFIHGILHIPGFIKAFGLAAMPQLPHPISRAHGILWAIAAVLFILTAALFFNYNKWWWMLSVMALIISQYLIFSDWEDAALGTALNIVILVITIIGYAVWSFSNNYHSEVSRQLKLDAKQSVQVLVKGDLEHLPQPVRQYVLNSGAVGQPRVRNFKVEFAGMIRSRDGAWMPFTSVQHNFIFNATRLFFMDAVMKQLPVAGYHFFKDGVAFMDIRIVSLFRVQYAAGEVINKAETVTFFNDMCCLAPATLIDPRIAWIDGGDGRVNATFTNRCITITADLFFNENNELVNFVSDDRPAFQRDGVFQYVPWSTPLSRYDNRLGYHLPRHAEAVYHYSEGDFTYGTFEVVKVSYNV